MKTTVIKNGDGISSLEQKLFQHEILPPDEMIALVVRAQSGDQSAIDAVISHNMKFILSLAAPIKRKHPDCSFTVMDLVQEGVIGMQEKAIPKFDPSRGIQFNSYAGVWVRQAMLKVTGGTEGYTIYVPHHAKFRVIQRRKIIEDLRHALGRDPTDDEISRELPAQRKFKLDMILSTASFRVLSLETPLIGQENRTLGDTISDASPVPFEALEIADNENKLSLLVEIVNEMQISQMQKTVFFMRQGLDSYSIHTLTEIAERFDITREGVRQIVWRIQRRITRKPSILSRLGLSEMLLPESVRLVVPRC